MIGAASAVVRNVRFRHKADIRSSPLELADADE